MKCRNKACGNDTFHVTVEHRVLQAMVQAKPNAATLMRMPVKLTCAKCGHKVTAWITNQQMKALVGWIAELATIVEDQGRAFSEFIDKLAEVAEEESKKGFLDKILRRG